MPRKRDHTRYEFVAPRTGRIIRKGITRRDPAVRESELRRETGRPQATLRPVGPKVTEESARAWEKRQRKGTPPGGR